MNTIYNVNKKIDSEDISSTNNEKNIAQIQVEKTANAVDELKPINHRMTWEDEDDSKLIEGVEQYGTGKKGFSDISKHKFNNKIKPSQCKSRYQYISQTLDDSNLKNKSIEQPKIDPQPPISKQNNLNTTNFTNNKNFTELNSTLDDDLNSNWTLEEHEKFIKALEKHEINNNAYGHKTKVFKLIANEIFKNKKTWIQCRYYYSSIKHTLEDLDKHAINDIDKKEEENENHVTELNNTLDNNINSNWTKEDDENFIIGLDKYNIDKNEYGHKKTVFQIIANEIFKNKKTWMQCRERYTYIKHTLKYVVDHKTNENSLKVTENSPLYNNSKIKDIRIKEETKTTTKEQINPRDFLTNSITKNLKNGFVKRQISQTAPFKKNPIPDYFLWSRNELIEGISKYINQNEGKWAYFLDNKASQKLCVIISETVKLYPEIVKSKTFIEEIKDFFESYLILLSKKEGLSVFEIDQEAKAILPEEMSKDLETLLSEFTYIPSDEKTSFIPKEVTETFLTKKFDELAFIETKNISIEPSENEYKISLHIHSQKEENKTTYFVTPCSLTFCPSLQSINPITKEFLEDNPDIAEVFNLSICSEYLSKNLKMNKSTLPIEFTYESLMKFIEEIENEGDADENLILWFHKSSKPLSTELKKNDSFLDSKSINNENKFSVVSSKKIETIDDLEEYWMNEKVKGHEEAVKKLNISSKPKTQQLEKIFPEKLPNTPIFEITLPLDSDHFLIKDTSSEVQESVNTILTNILSQKNSLFKGLFSEQKQTVCDLFKAWLQSGSINLSLPMGRGKTRIVCTLIKLIFKVYETGAVRPNSPMIIISPKALINNWSQELENSIISEEHLQLPILFKEIFSTRITPTTIYTCLVKTGYLDQNGKDTNCNLNAEEFYKNLNSYFPIELLETIRQNLIHYRKDALGKNQIFKLTQGQHFSSVPYIKGENIWEEMIKKGYLDKNGKMTKTIGEIETFIDSLNFNPNQANHPYSNLYKDFVKTMLHPEKFIWNNLTKNKFVARNGGVLSPIEDIHKYLCQIKFTSPACTPNTFPKKVIDYYIEAFKNCSKDCISTNDILILRDKFQFNQEKILLVNYESLKPAIKKSSEFQEFVTKTGLSIVVLDEAHKIADPDSDVSKQLNIISKKSTFRMTLTATPLGTDITDPLQIQKFLNNDQWNENNTIPTVQRVYTKSYNSIITKIQELIDGKAKKTEENILDLTNKMHTIQGNLVELFNNLSLRNIRDNRKSSSEPMDPRTEPPIRKDELVYWEPTKEQKKAIDDLKISNSDKIKILDGLSENNRNKTFNSFERILEHPSFEKNNNLYNSKSKELSEEVKSVIEERGVEEFTNASGLLKTMIEKIATLSKNRFSINKDGRYVVDKKGKFPSHILILTEKTAITNALKILIEKTHGIKTHIFDGKTSDIARQQILKEFNAPEEKPQVCLASKKTFGTGINLTYVSDVFLVKGYVPSLDIQSIGRAHRTGNQMKEITVHYFRSSHKDYSLDNRRDRRYLYRSSLGSLFNESNPEAGKFDWILNLFFKSLQFSQYNSDKQDELKELYTTFLSLASTYSTYSLDSFEVRQIQSKRKATPDERDLNSNKKIKI